MKKFLAILLLSLFSIFSIQADDNIHKELLEEFIFNYYGYKITVIFETNIIIKTTYENYTFQEHLIFYSTMLKALKTYIDIYKLNLNTYEFIYFINGLYNSSINTKDFLIIESIKDNRIQQEFIKDVRR